MGAVGYTTLEYDYFGLFNVPITIGSRNNNVTFAGGYGSFARGSRRKSPMLGLSIYQRLGPTVVLISENYHFPKMEDKVTFLQNGIRLFFRRGGAIDFHAIIMTGRYDPIVLPWVSFAVPFG